MGDCLTSRPSLRIQIIVQLNERHCMGHGIYNQSGTNILPAKPLIEVARLCMLSAESTLQFRSIGGFRLETAEPNVVPGIFVIFD
jgi:hypothetical protein